MFKPLLPAVAVALALASAPAQAGLELVEQDTKTIGVTTVTWDSSLQDLDYQIGTTIEAEIYWTVDAGAAAFRSFRLRGPSFTPKGPDPVRGFLLAADLGADSTVQGTSGNVQASFQFTELHCDARREVQIGNAHFALDLGIDTDGDGTIDSIVAYGVNVHVEAPGACAKVGRLPRRGPPGR